MAQYTSIYWDSLRVIMSNRFKMLSKCLPVRTILASLSLFQAFPSCFHSNQSPFIFLTLFIQIKSIRLLTDSILKHLCITMSVVIAKIFPLLRTCLLGNPMKSKKNRAEFCLHIANGKHEDCYYIQIYQESIKNAKTLCEQSIGIILEKRFGFHVLHPGSFLKQ